MSREMTPKEKEIRAFTLGKTKVDPVTKLNRDEIQEEYQKGVEAHNAKLEAKRTEVETARLEKIELAEKETEKRKLKAIADEEKAEAKAKKEAEEAKTLADAEKAKGKPLTDAEKTKAISDAEKAKADADKAPPLQATSTTVNKDNASNSQTTPTGDGNAP